MSDSRGQHWHPHPQPQAWAYVQLAKEAVGAAVGVC